VRLKKPDSRSQNSSRLRKRLIEWNMHRALGGVPGFY
jgi:hypothetical protein